MSYSIGVDVGTGSARAGVADVRTGVLLAVRKRDIKMWNPKPEHYEQSSADVWAAVCECVRGAMADAGVAADAVCGISFDATCSLVCLDSDRRPVGVDPTEPDEHERNIVVWLDHRAEAQAARINATGHARLRTVGNTISPEMEVPKLLWLKEHMPAAFARCSGGGICLDLADFLVYAATDYASDVRSLCTTVCKWNYDAQPGGGGVGWDRSFFAAAGFAEGDLPDSCLGADVRPPGAAVAGGVGSAAAAAMGLREGTALAVGMIDAHAGGVGCLGAALPAEDGSGGGSGGGGGGGGGGAATAEALASRLALICGTSTCLMASSPSPCFVDGVWGPYYGAMFDAMYLTEGGQSATGALIDHLIAGHACASQLASDAAATRGGVPPTVLLNERLEELAASRGVAVPLLAAQMHVTPDFAGNRSPLSDPSMRGAVVGLGLRSGRDELAVLYLAAVQALAYQTRHVVDRMHAAGHPPIRSVVACGGLAKNPLYAQAHADALRMPLHLPREPEAVLLGAAVLGATAGGAHGSVAAAMAAMSAIEGAAVRPTADAAVVRYHEKKYAVFLRMSDDQRAYREMMASE